MEAERCHSETTRDICSKHEMRDSGGDAARRSDVREDGSRCWTGGHSKPSQGPTLPVDAKTSFIKGQDAEARSDSFPDHHEGSHAPHPSEFTVYLRHARKSHTSSAATGVG